VFVVLDCPFSINPSRLDGDDDEDMCVDEVEAPEFWDCGDEDWPIRSNVLNSFLASHPAVETAGIPGIAGKANLIRHHEHQGDLLIVNDAKDVPEEKVFRHRFSCHEAHPGLCAWADAAIYTDSLQIAKNLEAALDESFNHRFIAVFCPDSQDHRFLNRKCFSTLAV
jgi:hypothetical protein